MSLKDKGVNAFILSLLGFNPCCNGMSLKETGLSIFFSLGCFNPCCNGMSLKESYLSLFSNTCRY